MPIISLTLPNDGDTASASTIDTPLTVIENLLNGGLDHDNMVDGGITGAKLAAATVTIDKLASSTIAGWAALSTPPNTVTYNGNRNYSVVVNATDLTPTISPGMRLKFTRSVTAPIQSANLNGSTQYFSKSSPANMSMTDNITVMAWVKLNAYGAISAIASRNNGSTDGWFCQIDAQGRLSIAGARAADDSALAQVSVPLNRWVHVAVTINTGGAAATMYYDGMAVGVSYTNNANSAFAAPTQSFLIGAANGAAPTSFFNGAIAQVAVFNTVLAQSTVQGYISQGFVGSEANEVSAYSLSNSLNDLNSNANNLTANASATTTNADSPFAGGVRASTAFTAGTVEFGEVLSIVFSTNTTIVVQAPENFVLPSTGGVSALAYSTHQAPLGWPPTTTNPLAQTTLAADVTTSNTSITYVAGYAIGVYVPAGRILKISWQGGGRNQNSGGGIGVEIWQGAAAGTLTNKVASSAFGVSSTTDVAAPLSLVGYYRAQTSGLTWFSIAQKAITTGTAVTNGLDSSNGDPNWLTAELM